MGSEDRELVRAALAGDMNAFALLVDRYRDPLYRYIQRHAVGPDSEDLLQDVFFHAWRHRHSFRSDGSFTRWIFLMALKRCSRWGVRKGRFVQVDVTLPIDALSVARAQEREREETRNEVLALVRDATARLDEKSALLVHLVYDVDVPVKLAARIVGVSRATAYRMLSLALEELREQLAEWAPPS
jgi:RNA polymerase sigma-70 factor (ECF subfamily)